ncbi:hypothetical protein F503_08625 [Ophiostoma piceae UAMH 11346]|uniref:Celp0028 effector like protein n=1 Tax=Ophiostoma piceae (strain UAMH 11346) TaxID=1262450 RepID=S3BU95_OPHP1|nr:hypothetical protein F503_08625 [Ophiostoma piceae UAMH 11346]
MNFFFTSTYFDKMLICLTTLLALVGFVTATPAPTILSHDDVILLDGNGQPQIMKASEFDALQARDMAAPHESSAMLSAAHSRRSGKLARGCEESTEVQVLSNTTLLTPDVAISPVISGENLTIASVSVTSGYSIANSIAVGYSEALTLVEDVLQVTLSVTYTETWTTTDSQTLSFNVPHDMFGVIVSQPYAREIKGNVLSGCTDSPTVNSFTSTTYSSQAYKDLNWVRGVMRLCTNESYPIPYCIGEGFHT